MCKHFDSAGGASAIDATMGREVLPKNVKPLHYHLKLEPDFDKLDYKGEVSIECVPIQLQPKDQVLMRL